MGTQRDFDWRRLVTGDEAPEEVEILRLKLNPQRVAATLPEAP